MDKTTPFEAWLQCLLKQAPPVGLLHVGAGSAAQAAPRWGWLYSHMPRVLAVEAQAEPFRRLCTEWAGSPHVEVRQALVASEVGPTTFYHASIRAESGLAAPEYLQQLWPNIRTTDIETLEAISLAELLRPLHVDGPVLNWLLIDCLPGGQLLQQADDALRSTDVVVVRAIDTAADDPEMSPSSPGFQLSELRRLLETAGLEWIGSEQAEHPGLVRAVFARCQLAINQRLTIRIAQLERDEAAWHLDAAEMKAAAAKQLAEIIARNDAQQAIWGQERAALVAARDEQAKRAAEVLAEREGLAKVNAALVAAREDQAKRSAQVQAERDGLAKEKAALIAASDEQAKRATQVQAEFDALAKVNAALVAARDEQAKRVAEVQAEREGLAKVNAALVAARDEQAKRAAQVQTERDGLAREIAVLTTARDEQNKLAAAHQKALATLQSEVANGQLRVKQLEAQNLVHTERQQLLREELAKAEAQLELIKDLLLRDHGP